MLLITYNLFMIYYLNFFLKQLLKIVVPDQVIYLTSSFFLLALMNDLKYFLSWSGY